MSLDIYGMVEEWLLCRCNSICVPFRKYKRFQFIRTIIISFRNQLGIKTMNQNMFPRNNSYVKSIRYLFYVLLVVCLFSYLVNLNKKQQFICEVKRKKFPLSLHMHSILHLSCGSITACFAFLKQYLETKI